jgi:tetratricopeptide (TPR) repeat protein
MSRLKTYTIVFLFPFLMTGVLPQASAQNPVISLERLPQQGSSKEQLALKYYKNKDYEKAAELFSQLYKEKPTGRYYIYYFNSLLYLKDYKTAEKLAKKQRKLTPGYRYEVDLAYVYEMQGENKKSKNIIRKLLNELPQDPGHVRQLAVALQNKGYYEESLEVYRKAQQMSEDRDYYMEMAGVYRASGDFGKMFDAYLQHLSNNPADMQLVKNRIQYYTRFDVDGNMSEMLRKKLLEKAQAEPGNLAYGEMLLWYSLQTKDFDMAFRQARALDMRFGNRDEDLLSLADIALSNKQYDVAVKSYDYVKKKKFDTPYYLESYAGWYHALVKKADADLETDARTYKELRKEGGKALEELGLNNETVSIAEDLSRVLAYHLHDYDAALALLDKAGKVEPMNQSTKANLKLLHADLLMMQDKVWDASLLYAQIEQEMKHEPIGHEAKLRNAKLFYYKGEFAWAQTRLDVLKSATSKLIANDAMELSLFINDILEEDTMGFTLRMFGTADLLFSQQQYDSALVWLNKIEKFPGGPNSAQYVLYKKAGIYVAKHDYQTADSLYGQLYTYYPQSVKADNALFLRAELNRLYLNKPEKAMELYLKLMSNYPDSMYSGEARVKYRALRKKEEEQQ